MTSSLSLKKDKRKEVGEYALEIIVEHKIGKKRSKNSSYHEIGGMDELYLKK